MEGKKTAGEEAKRERRMVNVKVRPRRAQRLSTTPQSEERWVRKVKDLGKLESKAVLFMPFDATEGKEDWEPVSLATPQPPWVLETMPA